MHPRDILSIERYIHLYSDVVKYWLKKTQISIHITHVTTQEEKKVMNKLTKIPGLDFARRALRLQKDSSLTSESTKVEKDQLKYEVEAHWGLKFLKGLPNTSKVIFSQGRKATFVFGFTFPRIPRYHIAKLLSTISSWEIKRKYNNNNKNKVVHMM